MELKHDGLDTLASTSETLRELRHHSSQPSEGDWAAVGVPDAMHAA